MNHNNHFGFSRKRNAWIEIRLTATRSLLSASCAIFLNVNISCVEFVEIDPPKTTLVSETVFTDDKTATAAIAGIYSNMTGSFAGFSNSSTTILTGLSSDELENYSSNPADAEFFNNTVSPENANLNYLWNEPYTFIFYANSVIEGLSSSKGVTPAVKLQLEGEAKFVRAFCHFYLTNLFGKVPYITTSDYRMNTTVSRLPISEVYDRIKDDLISSANLLPEEYPTYDRVRPNKAAAYALLSRVFLYSSDWTNAEATATQIIDQDAMYRLESDLNSVFLSTSQEAIWQLMPVIPGLNTVEAVNLIFDGSPFYVALSGEVVNAFEDGDYRRDEWVGSTSDGNTTYFYPNKYKETFNSTLTEYYMILRLSEQFLIRAEARAKQNKLSEAIADLDIVRARARLSLISDTNPDMDTEHLLLAIEQERKIELFAEWGHRWFDLKRTNRADAVLAPVKGDNWKSTDQLYPLPILQIQNDPNMANDQNPD